MPVICALFLGGTLLLTVFTAAWPLLGREDRYLRARHRVTSLGWSRPRHSA